MTATEAFDKWWAESPSMLAQDAFVAGFNAGLAQLAERGTCSASDAGSTPAPGSISAEDIYQAYPRKVGKADAIRAIEKAIKACRGLRISEASYTSLRGVFMPGDIVTPARYVWGKTKLYAAAVAKWPEEEKKYIPHPATWFNRGSYDDAPEEWVRGSQTKGRFNNAF